MFIISCQQKYFLKKIYEREMLILILINNLPLNILYFLIPKLFAECMIYLYNNIRRNSDA